MKYEVLFTPAEFEALTARDLGRTVCIVFDILRATTTMIVAMEQGIASIRPVRTIEEAVALRSRDPEILLAGERHGLRIPGALAGGKDFDFGNSPREFQRTGLRGRNLAMTTTNGTRALVSCASAKAVYPCAFRNLEATAGHVHGSSPDEVLLVCAGTGEETACEDVLAAGAMVECLSSLEQAGRLSDSAWIALEFFRSLGANLPEALRKGSNGRRLAAMPELAPDVEFCAQRNCSKLVAEMDGQCVIRPVKNY